MVCTYASRLARPPHGPRATAPVAPVRDKRRCWLKRMQCIWVAFFSPSPRLRLNTQRRRNMKTSQPATPYSLRSVICDGPSGTWNLRHPSLPGYTNGRDVQTYDTVETRGGVGHVDGGGPGAQGGREKQAPARLCSYLSNCDGGAETVGNWPWVCAPCASWGAHNTATGAQEATGSDGHCVPTVVVVAAVCRGVG